MADIIEKTDTLALRFVRSERLFGEVWIIRCEEIRGFAKKPRIQEHCSRLLTESLP